MIMLLVFSLLALWSFCLLGILCWYDVAFTWVRPFALAPRLSILHLWGDEVIYRVVLRKNVFFNLALSVHQHTSMFLLQEGVLFGDIFCSCDKATWCTGLPYWP